MDKVFNEGVVGVYHYKTASVEEGGLYYLSTLFCDSGVLEKNHIQELFEHEYSTKIHPGEAVGPFDGLDDLNRFAFRVCEEFDFSFISLHSVEQYNSSLQEVSDSAELIEKLLSEGNIIQNIERKKKGFFNKFFN